MGRSEQEPKEKIKSICGVLVNEEGEILLLRRTLKRTYWPGLWDLVGGEIQPGEEPSDAFIREMKEKFGFTPAYFSEEAPVDVKGQDSEMIRIPFICKVGANWEFVIDPKKYDAYQFAKPNEILSLNCTSHVVQILRNVGLIKS